MNKENNTKSLIGREFRLKFDTNKKREFELINRVFIDHAKKQHILVIAKSGSGKSYLARKLTENMIEIMENYSVIIIDPMGIFSTFHKPNTGKEVEIWNSQIPNEIKPQPMNDYEVWIPAGDSDKFDRSMYDEEFSLQAKDLSYGTLCFAFDMDPLEPMINLYRKAQKRLTKENPNYSIYDLQNYIEANKEELHFKESTIEALNTRLDALEELGIVRSPGVKLEYMIRRGKAVIFDLSMSESYTARIIVNFFSEKLLERRKYVTKKLTEAEENDEKIRLPKYIPPTQLIIDEAHNFFNRNSMLNKYIKEGRNVGCMLTAISQSPDLTRNVYANIVHLFVGQLVFNDDINSVRAMLPFEEKASDFRKEVKNLDVGCFYYYNIDQKTQNRILIAPTRTAHPASTEIKDEMQYILIEDESEANRDLKRRARQLEQEKEEYKQKRAKAQQNA